MNGCSQVENRLRALIDGELNPGEAKKTLAHLERCHGCRAEYERVRSIVTLLQREEPDVEPAHFTANLQLRLAHLRREKADREARWSFLRPLRSFRTPRFAGGVAGAFAMASVMAACVILTSRPSVADVTRKARESWLRIHNYGCTFLSVGTYQGQNRKFEQKQFFQRPDQFRLDTRQDYQLTTWVYPDRVVHYLPGGDWEHKGLPLMIVRPRTPGETALPFPFGVTWQNGGNVSLDQLIRQLDQNHDAQLLGEEKVGDRDAYHLRFTASAAPGSSSDQYELWVDKENFLPRRISWFRDNDNHIVTEARDMEVNLSVFPSGTFDYQVLARKAFVVQGDIDPHVLALPYVPQRAPEFDTQPVQTAATEIGARSGQVPFPVLAPEWMPEGYKLIRVRRKVGRWLDAQWMRERGNEGEILKLVERDARAELPADAKRGEVVKIGTGRKPLKGRLLRGTAPYQHLYLTWRRGRTLCTLFAAGMSEADLKQIALSMIEAPAPEPAQSLASREVAEVTIRGEPSLLPTSPEASATEQAPAQGTEGPSPQPEPVPMMPEMPDPERKGG